MIRGLFTRIALLMWFYYSFALFAFHFSLVHICFVGELAFREQNETSERRDYDRGSQPFLSSFSIKKFFMFCHNGEREGISSHPHGECSFESCAKAFIFTGKLLRCVASISRMAQTLPRWKKEIPRHYQYTYICT